MTSSKASIVCGGNNIAFDAAVGDFYNGGSTVHSFNLTVGSISNGIVILATQVATGETITGVTCGGVAMIQINTQANGFSAFDNAYLFYVLNPSSGSNTIEITTSGGSSFNYSSAASYSGVSQSHPIDTSVIVAAASGTSTTGTMTTNCPNDWLIAFTAYIGNVNIVISGGAGVTVRDTRGNYGALSDKAGGSAGSNSIVVNTDVSANQSMLAVALRSN